VPAVTGVQPGRPFDVALRLAHDPHWHTYWINPGTGLPTTPMRAARSSATGMMARSSCWSRSRRRPDCRPARTSRSMPRLNG
jgi:DsbC/DsbD-like thiol-disulfide interchange protein